MAQTLVSIRLDEELKKSFHYFCKEDEPQKKNTFRCIDRPLLL